MQGSVKLSPGTLIQRGMTVIPSVELNKQLFRDHARVSSTCLQLSIPTLPCHPIISFLTGSCTRSWTREYYRVYSITLQAALRHTVKCLAPAHKRWHCRMPSKELRHQLCETLKKLLLVIMYIVNRGRGCAATLIYGSLILHEEQVCLPTSIFAVFVMWTVVCWRAV